MELVDLCWHVGAERWQLGLLVHAGCDYHVGSFVLSFVGAHQVASRESFQAHSEALDAQISGLAAAQEQLESKLNTAAISLTKITEEQASLGGALQDNTCTLTEKMEVIEKSQQTFWAEVSNVAQASQQMMASIEAMIVEQTSLREKTTVTADNQESLRSTVQDQSELLCDRMSDLVAIQEQLRGNVDGLRELTQMVAGNVTNIAHEQETLHETVGAQPNLPGRIGKTWFPMASDGLISTTGLPIQQGLDHCRALAGPVPPISIANSRVIFWIPDPTRHNVADGECDYLALEYRHPTIVSWNRFTPLLDS